MYYLIALNPLKHFFFGGETTFSDSYLVQSNHYPQGSQIVGALKQYILENKGLMQVHRNGKYVKASKDTDQGRKKYQAAVQAVESLKYVSPTFLLHSKDDEIADALFEIPHDVVETKDQNAMEIIDTSDIPIRSNKKIRVFKNFSIKTGYVAGLGGKKFWETYQKGQKFLPNDILKYEQVFVPSDHVGIWLDKSRAIQGKFYSKSDFKLNDGYSFGIIVESDEALPCGIIQIGGENSMFSLKCEKIETFSKLSNHPVIQSIMKKNTPEKYTKAIALSELIMEKTIPRHINSAIADHYKSERQLKSAGSREYVGKTSSRRLVPRGSVFYIDNIPLIVNPELGYNEIYYI